MHLGEGVLNAWRAALDRALECRLRSVQVPSGVQLDPQIESAASVSSGVGAPMGLEACVAVTCEIEDGPEHRRGAGRAGPSAPFGLVAGCREDPLALARGRLGSREVTELEQGFGCARQPSGSPRSAARRNAANASVT